MLRPEPVAGWKLIISIALCLFLIQPAAAQGVTVYLPLVWKSGDCMATLAKLEISDGTTTVNLLTGTGQTGFSLRNWDPAVIQPKGGGVFQDSPMASGRRLVYAVDATAIEELTVDLNDYDQDGLIAQAQDLMRLLLKARAYQSTEFQDEPVWIRARSNCETNDRYALIINWAIPQLSNPYAQPFVSATEISTMDEISLQLERGHWLANEPGVEECAQISNQQAWEYDAILSEPTNPPPSEMTGFAQHSGGNIYVSASGDGVSRSTDGGDTFAAFWNAAPVPNPARGMARLANDSILAFGRGSALGTAVVIRTTNNAVPMTEVSDAAMRDIYDIVQVPTTGTVIAVGDDSVTGATWRSTDSGGTWTQIASYLDGQPIRKAVVAGNGDIIAAGNLATGQILYFKSSDDGVTWTTLSTINMLNLGAIGPIALMRASDGYLYTIATVTGVPSYSIIFRSTDHGATWGIAYSFGPGQQITLASLVETGVAGQFMAFGDDNPGGGPGNTVLYRSDDYGNSWVRYIPITTSLAPGSGAFTAADGSVFGNAFAVGSATMYRIEAISEVEMGSDPTCDNAVVIANHQNPANLTHVYRSDGAAYTSIFPAVLPTDIILDQGLTYFGSGGGVANSGPFHGLVFNISPVMEGLYNLIYEYWSGAAWSALTVLDNTNSFRNGGVSGIFWTPPSNWAAANLLTVLGGAAPDVTAYWVRVRLASSTGVGFVSPEQQTDQIYAPNRGHIEALAANIAGDIPALVRLKAYNLADRDGPGGSAPDLFINRLIAGLRSRGLDNFTAFLNISDRQSLYNIGVSLGTNTTFADDITAPTNRRAVYNPGGVEAMATRATISIDTSIARDFYGIFHAFLRARRTAGASTDLSIRLQVATGSGGITFTTSSKQLQTTTAFEVLDFGEIGLPVSGSFKSSDLADTTEIRIQASAASGTPDLYLYDLILVPVDEWAIDAVDFANESDSDVGRSNGVSKLLDVDSVTDPRVDIKALVRTADASGLITAEYNPVCSGPAILQSNVRQRLWMFAMRTSATGASYSWLAPPEIVHSIQAFKNERYLGQRGAR